MTPRRLRGLILLSLLLATGCLSASTASETQGTEYVVFVDFSGSIRPDDQALYKDALTTQIIPTLEPGDRLLIAPITDRTLTGFHPLVDVTLPPMPTFSGWKDNLLKHKKQVKEVEAQVPQLKEKIGQQVAGMFARHVGSPQTDIFSSLVLTEKLFHHESRHKVLVLMSDMIEDDAPYRFEKVSWTPDATRNLLDNLNAQGMVPDLSGVCIYVAGASANSPAQAEQIGAFWNNYFQRTHADTDPSRYAHVLLHWPPSESCTF
jgi:hypothetical protein